MNIPWNISIVNTGLGLGSKTIANDSLVEKMRHDGLARPEKIVNSIGIKNRYIVGEKEDHEFLVKKSLDQTSWAKKTKPPILLCVCTQTDPISIPSLARRAVSNLEISGEVHVIQIHSGCTGFIEILNIVNAQLEINGLENAIIINADIFSNLIDSSDWTNSLLFSDGAVSTIIERSPQKHAIYDTVHFDNSGCLNLNLTEAKYSMNGLNTFTFTATEVEKALARLASETKKLKIEISTILLHQASMQIISMISLAAARFFPLATLPTNISSRGNLNSASIPALVHDNISYLKNSKRSQYTAFLGFGAGLCVTYLAVPNTTFRNYTVEKCT